MKVKDTMDAVSRSGEKVNKLDFALMDVLLDMDDNEVVIG